MSEIDAKQAIKMAKEHVATLFMDELQTPPTLEEIWLDDMQDEWCVTVGVRRASSTVRSNIRDSLAGIPPRLVPDYKVVRVSRATSEIRSLRNREMA
jgi:hypothetical protein